MSFWVKASKLYDTEHAQAMHLTLEPGERLRLHATPVDAFFYVLQGADVVEIGDEKKSVGPDPLIPNPARIPHCWYNEGDAALRVLVIKVPRPTEMTRHL